MRGGRELLPQGALLLLCGLLGALHFRSEACERQEGGMPGSALARWQKEETCGGQCHCEAWPPGVGAGTGQ